MKKKGRKNIKPEEFFKLVAVNSRMVDLEIVKMIYYGLVRTVTKELKGSGKVKLPDFGEFVLKVRNVRKGFDINTRTMVPRTPIAVIRFVPDWKVKRYFYDLGKDGTMVK